MNEKKQPNHILMDLIELSHWLGAPEQDCAILGEGNASARVGDSSFFVKASGTELGTLEREGVIEVDFRRAREMSKDQELSDSQVHEMLIASKVDSSNPRLPSVETALHAVCLSQPEIRFVGHTHPTAINAITCSKNFSELLKHYLFPDQIVVCGPEPLLIPYIDPGVMLAKVVLKELDQYVTRRGIPPKAIYLQNHGFIALGKTAKQVRAITAMAVKAARILLGSLACGGPNSMKAGDVERIHNRLDEHYRQKIIEND